MKLFKLLSLGLLLFLIIASWLYWLIINSESIAQIVNVPDEKVFNYDYLKSSDNTHPFVVGGHFPILDTGCFTKILINDKPVALLSSSEIVLHLKNGDSVVGVTSHDGVGWCLSASMNDGIVKAKIKKNELVYINY